MENLKTFAEGTSEGPNNLSFFALPSKNPFAEDAQPNNPIFLSWWPILAKTRSKGVK
jgi:hypothetical protein